MLYEPDRHEPIVQLPWDATRADAAIRRMVNRATALLISEGKWPVPKGEEDNWQKAPPATIYLGAMGILWTLSYLRQYLDTDITLIQRETSRLICESFKQAEHAEFAGQDGSLSSYLLGETGLLFVQSKLDPEQAAANWDRIYALAKANIRNPSMEPLWGGTGSIIPALFRLEAGAEDSDRWQRLLAMQCTFMRDSLEQHEGFDCPVWVQDLYGNTLRLTGAGHGFVGNMYPFVRGARYLPPTLAAWALQDSVETIVKSATLDGDCCNWMSSLDGSDRGRPAFLMQWCHGAPGVITSLNNIPAGYSKAFDELMIKAGEAIWRAGPLKKGTGLCHGTDGNGFALLKLYRRTGNTLWLDRARAFAMHALRQTRDSYSLWVGDFGLACFLHACLTETDDFPLMDVC